MQMFRFTFLLKDLGQIGAHNKRKKEAYQSNPDIDKSKSHENKDIVPVKKYNYHSSYMEVDKDYKKQHDEKQKTERKNRKKTFTQMLDDSNSVIADELLFTSDKEIFKDMTKDEIVKWTISKKYYMKDQYYLSNLHQSITKIY